MRAGASDARYLLTGHLVYMQESVLTAMPFDVRGLVPKGPAVPVVPGVQVSVSGAGFYDISSAGTLVYVPGAGTGGLSTLAWVDESGRRQAIGVQPGVYQQPRKSPDGQWRAVERD